MSGETERYQSGWTVDTWAAHTTEVQRLQELIAQERDRRYHEVDQEREKAVQIKDKADDNALGLAREIQTYKDQQHNGLLDQLTKERGTYVTQSDLKGSVEKIEATIKPIAEYVSSVQGRDHGVGLSWGVLLAGIAGLAVLIDVLSRFIK